MDSAHNPDDVALAMKGKICVYKKHKEFIVHLIHNENKKTNPFELL
jgi:hypothetical protein